jgi:tagatose-6-phosphate ketose/aldose isomerase
MLQNGGEAKRTIGFNLRAVRRAWRSPIGRLFRTRTPCRAQPWRELQETENQWLALVSPASVLWEFAVPDNPASSPGSLTRQEILQQPDTWPETVRRVRAAALGQLPPAVLTGAGTSAYAGVAVEPAWPGSAAIATTDLVLEFAGALASRSMVVSFARSGNSPESVAVVDKIHRALPQIRHVAITANPEGALAQRPEVRTILLDPRTNDRSLVMTSSFSNLVLGGLCLARPEETERALPALCEGGREILESHETTARELSVEAASRVVILASQPLLGLAREAWLKILEMTAGQVVPLVETYLGLRHGPMSFLRDDALVVCVLSSDARRRRYELDLVRELRQKGLGRRVALGPVEAEGGLFEHVIRTEASDLPDFLRTPAEVVFAQLLGYHLSLRLGLDPDNPSPAGVINRVVQGVRIYED